MQIKHAIESIQHNFLLNTHEKMGLMGLFQELEQYRQNPLLQMQPCWKYVRENDINMQLQHVMSECDEVDRSVGLNDMALEWFDILQGAVTGMFILKIKYGVDLMELIQQGIRKNTDREGGSYYE